MLQEAHAQGGAQRISLRGRENVQVEDGHYTTCNPDDEVWVLEARRVELDRIEHIGVARDVWVRVHGVPVFYSPVLAFPLSDERKSGLLPPKIRVSDASGLELGADYYLNLAPNRDATLGGRWLRERGVLASGEYRYLMPWGSGRLSGEYMPEDRKYGGERGALGFRHLGSFASRWSADVDYQWASDSDYFEDFGSDLDESTRSHLPQRADLVYAGPWFWTRGRIQDYQTLDDLEAEHLPYARLPQILAMTRLPERNRQINFAGAVELTRFERASGITGNRADLHSSLHFPLRSPSAFLVPRLGLRLTHYDLSGTASGADETPSPAAAPLQRGRGSRLRTQHRIRLAGPGADSGASRLLSSGPLHRAERPASVRHRVRQPRFRAALSREPLQRRGPNRRRQPAHPRGNQPPPLPDPGGGARPRQHRPDLLLPRPRGHAVRPRSR